MVQRVSEALNIKAGQGGAIQQSGMGGARADFAGNQVSHERERVTMQDDSADRVLQSVLGVVSDFGKKTFIAGTEEAYLEGVAKAGTIENESELQGNILTRDWQTAGYRDTMGRLKQADIESQKIADMPQMRQESPEKYKEYITKKRQELLPQLEGMSRQQRQSMLAQVMLQERADIRKHGSEHGKFIIETKHKAIKAQAVQLGNNLNAAKGDPVAYKAQIDAGFAKIYQMTAGDPSLPDSEKANAIVQFGEYALENNHQALYDAIQKGVVPLADGKPGKLMSSYLDFDQESKLGKAYTASMERTAHFRLQKYSDEHGALQAQWKDENQPLPEWQQVADLISRGQQNGFYKTPQQLEATWQDYYTQAAKRGADTGVAQAYSDGNRGFLLAGGYSDEQAGKAWIKSLAKQGKSTEQIADALLENGARTGQAHSYKVLGGLYAPMLAQLGSVDKVNAENAGTLTRLILNMGKLEADGKQGIMHNFMQGIPEGQRDIMSHLIAQVKAGNAPEVAANQAMTNIIEDSKLSAPARAARVKEGAAADVKEIEAMEPESWFGARLWTGAKALLGSDAAAAELVLSGKKPLIGAASAATTEMNFRARNELLAEAQDVRMTAPSLQSPEVLARARANVLQRTVDTEHGPFILPKGMKPQDTFGIPNADNERIGIALNKMYPAPKDGSTKFDVNPLGQIVYQQFNDRGERVGQPMQVDGKAVGLFIQQERAGKAKQYGEVNGAGVVKKVGDGTVNFNGDNTHRLPNDLVFKLREKLVDHEGFASKPYKDISNGIVKHGKYKGQPVMTVGAGISNTNDFYPEADENGVITPEALDKSFRAASNQAAGIGSQMMAVTGLKNDAAFMLFSELAYQSGTGAFKHPSFTKMMAAVKAKDEDGAIAALKALPAYGYNPDETHKRGKHYIAQLKLAMKG